MNLITIIQLEGNFKSIREKKTLSQIDYLKILNCKCMCICMCIYKTMYIYIYNFIKYIKL